ncbi:MAG: hypothetical protein HYX65_04390 [Gemmatimonadetes bacterium]|nr:hypothetical protein [Gemmatimonadota bacterium]
MTGSVALPPGVSALRAAHATGAARDDLAGPVAAILETGRTLHAWAGSQSGARPMHGRGVLWAVPIAGLRAVVRHSRHGGWLAPVTRDLFRAPSRAPHEMATSRELQRRGVPTPDLLAWASYPAPLGLVRADVVTLELTGGEDLLTALGRADPAEREGSLVPAVGELLAALRKAGAWHPDLNLKNVLLTPVAPRAHKAWVLDVDVVQLGAPGNEGYARLNLERLLRSAIKRRREMRSPITSADVAAWTRAIG